MRPEDLDVNLRPRSSWEAMELGTALVRRHAAAVWKPWLLATLPLFVLLNAAAWALDLLWLAGLLMWWLKPAFARIPLYVISRGVFGQVPGTWQTLRAQWRFGLGMLPAYLLWRRLGPARALLMPVDLLEGTAPEQRRLRRRVLGGPAYGQAALLTWTCWHFELALALGCVAAVFLMIPAEFLSGSFQSFWHQLEAGMPPWMQLVWNVFAWAGICVIEPFYVGAGFGMYLNRRTETEAWDVELAFRRLGERLRRQATAIALVLATGVLCAGLVAPPVHAQQAQSNSKGGLVHEQPVEAADVDEEHDPRTSARTLDQVFDGELADDAGFRAAARKAYEDPLLGSKRTVTRWQPRERERDEPDADGFNLEGAGWMAGLAGLFALVAEWGLWALLGVAVLIALLTMRYWLPWLRGTFRRGEALPESEVATEILSVPVTLPDDIPTAVRRLWHDGRRRAALALLYRASVEAMLARTGAVLPPGATEAHCLRASRRLPDEPARALFARMVRTWQYAAYAGRLPDDAGFEDLLDASSAQWRWTA